MKCVFPSTFTAVLLLAIKASALDYSGLATVDRMRAEGRFDEAARTLETLADRATGDGDQFRYLQAAIDIALAQLKDANRAEGLAEKIRDPARRDFARLRLLSAGRRYADALALAKGKNIDTWPLDCRGSTYRMLGDMSRSCTNEGAALDYYAKAVSAPGASVVDRGRSAYAAGNIYLSQGNRSKAEEMFRKGLAITPGYYSWRNGCMLTLSQLLIEEHRTAEAVQLFESVHFEGISIAHSRARLQEAYARALLADGQKIRAAETFDAVLQSNIPPDWKARIEQELDLLADDM